MTSGEECDGIRALVSCSVFFRFCVLFCHFLSRSAGVGDLRVWTGCYPHRQTVSRSWLQSLLCKAGFTPVLQTVRLCEQEIKEEDEGNFFLHLTLTQPSLAARFHFHTKSSHYTRSTLCTFVEQLHFNATLVSRDFFDISGAAEVYSPKTWCFINHPVFSVWSD